MYNINTIINNMLDIVTIIVGTKPTIRKITLNRVKKKKSTIRTEPRSYLLYIVPKNTQKKAIKSK